MAATVWILGAGASIGAANGDFPTIRDFFRFAKKLGLTTSGSRSVAPSFLGVRNYLLAVFGKDILDENDDIDIEQVLTSIDIDIHKSQNPLFEDLKASILKLVTDVLVRLSADDPTARIQYVSFANTIDPKDTIVTFNWDIELDNVLGRIELLKTRDNWERTHYGRFLFHYTAIGEASFRHVSLDPPYETYDPTTGYFLKLHGSIDWLACTNNLCRAFGRTFPVETPGKDMFCGECHEKSFPVLVPPVLIKDIEDLGLIRKLWNTAVKELQTANQVIVWGYSLPPTDFYSSWLLRQTPHGLSSLAVVNPSCVRPSTTRPTWNYAFLRNLLEPFRGRIDKKNIAFYEDFDKFVAGNNVMRQYGLTGC